MDISWMSPQFAEHEDEWVAINAADNAIVCDWRQHLSRQIERLKRRVFKNVLLFKVPRFDVGFIRQMPNYNYNDTKESPTPSAQQNFIGDFPEWAYSNLTATFAALDVQPLRSQEAHS